MTITEDKDKVRLLIGDTDEANPLLYDDEVQNFIDQRAVIDSSGGTASINLPAAAADCAGAIAAKFARDFDFSEDGQNFSRAQRVGHYLSLERELRNRAGGYVVSSGGTLTTT